MLKNEGCRYTTKKLMRQIDLLKMSLDHEFQSNNVNLNSVPVEDTAQSKNNQEKSKNGCHGHRM